MDEKSGCIPGFPKLGLNCDHIQMNKFSDSKDVNYSYVQNELARLVLKATDRVNARLNCTCDSCSVSN